MLSQIRRATVRARDATRVLAGVLLISGLLFGCCGWGGLELNRSKSLTLFAVLGLHVGFLTGGSVLAVLSQRVEKQVLWATVTVLVVSGTVSLLPPLYLMMRVWWGGLTAADVMLAAVLIGICVSAVHCVIAVARAAALARRWADLHDVHGFAPLTPRDGPVEP